MTASDGSYVREPSLFDQWKAGRTGWHYGFHYSINGEREQAIPFPFPKWPVDVHVGYWDTYEECFAAFSEDFDCQHGHLYRGWELYGGTYQLRGWILGKWFLF